ncbi:MAG: protein translocase subunit SecD [Patescibacteria group bacterium]
MSKPSTVTVPRSAVKQRALLLLVLALLVGGVAYPPAANRVIDTMNYWVGTHLGHIEKGFVLGLDLQGGTRLDYEADVSQVPASERAASLDGVRDVIERRVNSLGVSEPLITTAQAGDSWRVSAELAGIRDVNQAIKLIGETPILEFKEENTEPQRDLTAEETKAMDAKNAEAKKKAEADLAQALKDPGSVEALAKSDSSDQASKALGGDLGFLKGKPQYQPILDAVKNLKAGEVLNRLVDLPGAYVIAKVEEVKASDPQVNGRHILIQWAGAQSAPTSTTRTKEEAKKALEDIKKQVTAANFTDMAKKYSEEPGAKESGGDLGWFGKGDMVEPFEKAIYAMKKGDVSDIVETQFGYHLIFKADERPTNDVRARAVFIKQTQASDILPPQGEWKNTQLGGKQLKSAKLDFDQNSGSPQIALQFDDEGTKLFADITKRNVGKRVAIFLDGNVEIAPTVQTEIANGQAVITGNYTIEEAKTKAMRLQQGALPIPIKLIAQQTVGSTLGQDSVNKSLTAGIWGFVFVALFMLFWYRLPGLMSIVSLCLYVGISFSIFKLLPVTLTLAGIAGFILSLGIAVDANVLVFERLKEEVKSGKGWLQALEEAFRRAWPSIRDGNTTTLIACAVLYWFSSSIIKGFALTLAVGILTSLFTSIIVTRTLLRLVAMTELPKRMPWLFLNKTEDKK